MMSHPLDVSISTRHGSPTLKGNRVSSATFVGMYIHICPSRLKQGQGWWKENRRWKWKQGLGVETGLDGEAEVEG
jgi:hypothetical protein